MTSRGDFNQDIVVRFAPSPNGLLHLGHAYAAMIAHDYARNRGGSFLLRIEDIDTSRTRPEFVEAILDDLRWLDLQWDGEVIFQSTRFDDYAVAIEKLKIMDLLYPCFCTRSSMRASETTLGPDGPIYAGTCRSLSAREITQRMQDEPHSWRLDVQRAVSKVGALQWDDETAGMQIADPLSLGDVVIVPKETPISYHLAVTLDDARDGITHVVRGKDLFASTHIHRLLQALFELPVPQYFHHPILLDEEGQKLSKSIGSASLSELREQYPDGRELLDALRNNQLPLGIALSNE